MGAPLGEPPEDPWGNPHNDPPKATHPPHIQAGKGKEKPFDLEKQGRQEKTNPFDLEKT